MTTSPARALLWASLPLLALATGCNKEKTPAAGNFAPAASGEQVDPNAPVAEVSGETITAGELEKEIEPQLKSIQTEYEKKKYELRKQALDQMIVERLVKAEAQKQGMTEEEFLRAEVEKVGGEPSEEQVRQLYEGSKSRLPPGTTYEQVRPQIVDYLKQRQRGEQMGQVFSRLKEQAGVKVFLSQPRTQVAATGPSKGPDNAPVTIVEFSDFECPFCGRVNPSIKQVMDTYPGKVRVVFRHFPLNFHPNAQKAGEASMCAHDQGKFWEMHDVLFENQKKLSVDQLKQHAQSIGLDMEKFNKCLDSGEKAEIVQRDLQEGQQAGVSGTPAFFINGIPLSGAVPFEQFKEIIDQELASR